MRLAVAFPVALVAAVVGGTVALLVAAWAAGRLDLFRNRPGETFFLVWGTRSGSGLRGIIWEIVAAMTRAIGAFAAGRLVLVLFAVTPGVSFALALVAVFIGWELWNLSLFRRAPIRAPSEVASWCVFQATSRVLASMVIAPFFIRLWRASGLGPRLA